MTHAHDAHAHADPDDFSRGGLDDLLDLDAEVLQNYWDQALSLVSRATDDQRVGRVLDLGAGTGTASIRLARRFPDAEVVAVDSSDESLRRLQRRAAELGLADRIRAISMDLDTGVPDIGPVDVTWASMALHHLVDPVQTLRDVHAATRAGGLVAVAEFERPLRFLVDGAVSPGFEDRLTGALSRAHQETLPHLDDRWTSRLEAAEWTVLGEHGLSIDLVGPTGPDAGRYARTWFARLAQGIGDQLEPRDRDDLARLVDGSPIDPSDLHLRGMRTVTVARR